MAQEKPKTDVQRAAGILIIIAATYLVLQHLGLLNFLLPSRFGVVDMSYGVLFILGLLGSVHCIAVCGGINLSQCLPQCLSKGTCCVDVTDAAGYGGIRVKEGSEDVGANAVDTHTNGDSNDINANNAAIANNTSGSICGSILLPSILYNVGRVASYTMIGAAAGALGAAVTFSVAAQSALKLAAGALMLIIGINMLQIFPWIRRFLPKMPKFIDEKIYRSKGPLIVGLLNGFMPCGPLQVVQIYALSTGSPARGALSMLLFSLGTVPLMFGLGTFSSAIGKTAAKKVVTAGGVMVAVLGLCMLSQGWNLFGVPIASLRQGNSAALDIAIDRGPQFINSTLSPYSYPSIRVETGRPVKWIINAPDGSINGCNNRLIIREYGINHEFRPGENIIEFTPQKRGRVPFSCGMGIITGTIRVVGPGEGGEGILKKRQRPPKEGEPCC
ncbi:MAG: sulfite exporter TauE/SafE family protein [Chitinispirillia bacterium]|nr:sulfite exporter TauE/SafE family protein [Chitinispirillia bacterium]MCL2268562.1 sulfite exporter TauE/SafE family protein [Chitinispirillia bacterium]